MPHAFFDNWKHVDARKIWQQRLQRDQAAAESSRLLGLGQFLELDGLFDGEFPHGGAFDFGKMRAASHLLPHFVRQRADVRAGGTFNFEARQILFNTRQAVFEEFHVHGL